jgi:hypothetical protein
MTTTPENEPSPSTNSADASQDLSLFAEFWLFLRENKKWWLTPIIIVLLLLGGLVYLSGTAAAPLIYTLF